MDKQITFAIHQGEDYINIATGGIDKDLSIQEGKMIIALLKAIAKRIKE